MKQSLAEGHHRLLALAHYSGLFTENEENPQRASSSQIVFAEDRIPVPRLEVFRRVKNAVFAVVKSNSSHGFCQYVPVNQSAPQFDRFPLRNVPVTPRGSENAGYPPRIAGSETLAWRQGIER